MYYTIGTVSKLVGLSVKALRYYERIDLIKPAKRDLDSGYRYYTQNQITTLTAIKYLNSDCGLSLTDIKALIGTDQDNFSYIDWLKAAEIKLQEKIAELQKSQLILQNKIAHLNENESTTLFTPSIHTYPDRPYYLKTTKPLATHPLILHEMFIFRNELCPSELFQMGAFFFSDPNSEDVTWQNNGILLFSEESLPAPRMILPGGDYLSIHFNNPFENFEVSLGKLKKYINEHQLKTDYNFYMIIDTFDGSIANTIKDHLFELQIQIKDTPNLN